MHLTITKYSELEQYLKGFAAGHGNLLVIVGSAGIQKSSLAQAICPQARVLSGQLTAFQLFRELWRHRDHEFIVDDVDAFYGDRAAVRLLKNLCDTREPKILHWHTAATALMKESIPMEFETQTRLIMIANEWRALNKNIGALEDRGILLTFKPTAEEVHRRVQIWFSDQEIHKFIGAHLTMIPEATMRDYINAANVKAMGMDWRDALLKSWNTTSYTAAVIKLLDQPGLTQEERVQKFVATTGGCRATFFNIQHRLGRMGNGLDF